MKTSGWIHAGAVVGALILAFGCAPADDTTGPPDVRLDGDGTVGADADADGDGTPPPVDGDDVVRPEVPDVVEEACDQEEFEIARVIPDMLIVLDRSNSMFDEESWNPVREAIYAVTAEMDREIWFGLMLFPNVTGSPVCSGSTAQCEPGHEPLVGVAEGNGIPIRDALGPMLTCGGTPTAQTLQNARAYLDTLAADGHPKFILLATDGAPNCNSALDGYSCVCTNPSGGCSINNLNCLDDARTMAIVEDIRASGIQIFVLGIRTSEWSDILNEMAARGGTGGAFFAEDPASMRAAFEDIAGSIASCEFDMRAPDPSADPDRVNFYFDGVVVPSDSDGTCDNGWAWTDGTHTRVEFCGSYCDDLLGRRVTNVSATWGCPTVLI
ncbi:MAG: VWA domain-containing protein [Myxococcales bacterium]|nr:VWA domain-containing protein [Myxococcales bacterium]